MNTKCRAPSNQERNRQANDSGLRILNIVDLASLLGTEAFDSSYLEEPLESFIDAVLDLEYTQHPSLTPLNAVFGAPGGSPEEWENKKEHERETLLKNSASAERKGFLGFGVQFATPVRKYLSPDCVVMGWGYCSTMWCYAESIDEAWQLGVTWAEQQSQKAKAKAGFSNELKP